MLQIDNFIEELVKTVCLNDRIGMVSGKILRMDKITIDSTGLFLGKSRKPVERGFNQKDRGQYNKEGYIFGVSGAAAFYRRAMLEDIKDENGYFDQRYGMFYEDLDLAWRASKKGWRGYYTPKAIAYHKRGASAKASFPSPRFFKKYSFVYLNNALKIRLIKNRYLTIIKNDSFWGIIFNLPFILTYEIKLYIYIILFSPKLLGQILKSLL
jgi:GT2 family glycosyltransferase